MKFIIDKYNKVAPLYKFLLNGILLVLVWLIFYQFIRYSLFVHQFYESFTAWLTNHLLVASMHVMKLLGYDTEVSGKTIRIVGTGGVYLDRGCLGRNLLGLFAGFIIAYPGKIKYKLWYIPAGLIVINIINIARICGLAYIVLAFPQYVDINHHVIFKYTAYTFIFLMWYFWIKNYSVSARLKKKPKLEEKTS